MFQSFQFCLYHVMEYRCLYFFFSIFNLSIKHLYVILLHASLSKMPLGIPVRRITVRSVLHRLLCEHQTTAWDFIWPCPLPSCKHSAGSCGTRHGRRRCASVRMVSSCESIVSHRSHHTTRWSVAMTYQVAWILIAKWLFCTGQHTFLSIIS